MRHDSTSEDEFGQDSFLDVVANVVGVLIILVMLIGVRASHSLLQADPISEVKLEQPLQSQPNLAQLTAELDDATRQAVVAERRFQETAARIQQVSHASTAQKQRRIELAMHRTVMEEELERRRSRLTKESQREFDVQKQLVEVKLELDNLTKQQLNLLSAPEESEEVEVVPTPVARRVDEEALHIRVKQGRVCIVPFYELLDEVESQIEAVRRAISNNDRTKLTFGPRAGFRIRMTMMEHRASGPITGPRVGIIEPRKKLYPVFHWLPISGEIDQNIEQTLLPSSRFLSRMKDWRKQSDVIVVWLYKDSFDQFRPLKKALYEMGFRFDIRILNLDKLIAASPYGRESLAQ